MANLQMSRHLSQPFQYANPCPKLSNEHTRDRNLRINKLVRQTSH